MRWPLISLLWLLGCPRPPTPPPPPPPVAVPEGCLADLSGRYVHADDGSFTYEVRDDGGTLTVEATHHLLVDAGFRPRLFGGDGGFRVLRHDAGVEDGGAPAASPAEGSPPEKLVDAGEAPPPIARLTFTRTATGFTGASVSTVTHPGGRSCEARFAAEVLACGDGGLTLAVEGSTALGDACQAPARPSEERVRHRLQRQQRPGDLSAPAQ